MSALYQMQFAGAADTGAGALYVGRNKIVGIDTTRARYRGSYTQTGSTISGTVTLTSAGGRLVTGQAVPAGQTIQIAFQNLPADMGNGQPQTVTVAGNPVRVTFSKIDDTP